MRYLLDTCIISELVAQSPNPRVIAWVDSIPPELVYLSVITIGEIRKGIEKLPDSKRKVLLQEWLDEQLLIRFSGRIVPLDVDIFLTWGELIGQMELAGKPMAAMDSLIAASAKHRQLTIVTRNVQDFKYTGLLLINPWDD